MQRVVCTVTCPAAQVAAAAKQPATHSALGCCSTHTSTAMPPAPSLACDRNACAPHLSHPTSVAFPCHCQQHIAACQVTMQYVFVVQVAESSCYLSCCWQNDLEVGLEPAALLSEPPLAHTITNAASIAELQHQPCLQHTTWRPVRTLNPRLICSTTPIPLFTMRLSMCGTSSLCAPEQQRRGYVSCTKPRHTSRRCSAAVM